MAKTVINVKVDKDTKKKAQVLAKDLGLPLSTIINANLREFVRSGEVVFSIEPKIKPEVWKLLRKASADYKAGKNISPRFSSAKEAIRYLNS
ncbi:MAG: type II toxin-antitoxin system RelB/DinJ family antitoxin [Parcubacteria group bacterium]|nr:type II toxin-antitoxin system RelB/DinJ family antitoxin [Parcubacteria group bacterium]